MPNPNEQDPDVVSRYTWSNPSGYSGLLYDWDRRYDTVTLSRRHGRTKFRQVIEIGTWRDIVDAVGVDPNDWVEYRLRERDRLMVFRWEPTEAREQRLTGTELCILGMADTRLFKIRMHPAHWHDVVDFMAMEPPVLKRGRMALLRDD